MKIKNQIMIFVLLIIVIPMLIINTVIFRLYTQTLLNSVNDSSQLALAQVSQNIDSLTSDIISASNIIVGNKDVTGILEKENYSSQDYIEIHDVMSLAQSSVLYLTYSEIVIFDIEYNYFTSSSTFSNLKLKEYLTPELYEETVALGGRVNWSQSQYDFSIENYEDMQNIIATRAIMDESMSECLGIVLIVTFPHRLFADNPNPDTGSFFIAQNEKIVYTDNNLGELIDYDLITLDENSNNYEQHIENKDYIINTAQNARTNFDLIHLADKNLLLHELNMVTNLQFFFLIIISIAFFALSIYFVNRILDPLAKLSEHIKNIKDYRLAENKFVVNGSKEINDLAEQYNLMLNKVASLITQIETDHKQREKLRFQSLQNQINPHFIFNTLNSIKIIVQMREIEKSVNMIVALGNMLKHILTNSNEMIPLHCELDNVKNYCAIQKIRYGNIFDLIVDVPTNCLNEEVPCLLLQPIVENSIIHGIFDYSENGLITVTCEKDGAILLISIRDNGCGLNRNKLKEEIYSEQKSTHLGLRNIMERIKLIYGEHSSLEIAQTEQGSCITLLLTHEENSDNKEHYV